LLYLLEIPATMNRPVPFKLRFTLDRGVRE